MNVALRSPTQSSDTGSQPLRVEFLTQLAQLDALQSRWEHLTERQGGDQAPFFQSYPWIRHVTETRMRWSPERHCILIAAVWRGPDLVAVWPLSLKRELRAWTARSLDDPFGQFSGALFEEEAVAAPAVAAILEALRGRADRLIVEAVRLDSPLRGALAAGGAKTIASFQAVIVDLRPFATFRDFALSMKSKTRKNLRNLGNRLRRAHGVEHAIAYERAPLSKVVKSTYDARVQWLRRHGRTSSAFRDDDFRPLVDGVCQADGLSMLGFSLTAGGAWLSSQWGFVLGDRYYAYMSAMNQDFDEFSPGRLHLGMVIEACYEQGLKVLELMPPAADYKLDWGGKVKDLETMALSFTTKGRVANLVTARVVPAARRLSRALPQSWRKGLVGQLNRK